MPEMKKWRLGNQDREYELSEKYLGWMPKEFGTWEVFNRTMTWVEPGSMPEEIVLTSPDGMQSVTLNTHQRISKEAFPLEFYGEDRARDWFAFYIVSEKETPEEKFIIPMY